MSISHQKAITNVVVQKNQDILLFII